MVDLALRPSHVADVRLVWEWRNDPITRSMSLNPERVEWDEHVAWFHSVLSSADRLLLIAEDAGAPVAVLRFDRVIQGTWEVSINVAPSARGRGIGISALRAAAGWMAERGGARLVARVRTENERSLRAFQTVGFVPTGTTEGVVELELPLMQDR